MPDHRIELMAVQGPYENPDLIRFTGQAQSAKGKAFPVEFHMSLQCFQALEEPKTVVLRVRGDGADGSGQGPNTGPRG